MPNPVHRPLDALDRDILAELVRDGRLPNNVLAERLGIAPSTCLLRTQNLVKRGVIRGFRADVDHTLVGAGPTMGTAASVSDVDLYVAVMDALLDELVG